MPEVEIDIDDLLEVNSDDERASKLQVNTSDPGSVFDFCYCEKYQSTPMTNTHLASFLNCVTTMKS